MAKYEIMLLVDPKTEGKESLTIAKEVFPDFKETVLEKTELAYEINKSMTGKYFVAEVEATGDQVKEFNRRANITKSLWRFMIINLDKEVGRDGAAEKMEAYSKKQAERAAERAAYRESRIKDREARMAKRVSRETKEEGK